MKKCIFLTFDGLSKDDLYDVMDVIRKTEFIKKYEVILSNKEIKPQSVEDILQLCDKLLEAAKAMIR